MLLNMKFILTADNIISSENKKKNRLGFNSAMAIAKEKKPKDNTKNIGIVLYLLAKNFFVVKLTVMVFYAALP